MSNESKPKMVTWVKKGGKEVILNNLEATVVEAKSLGWKEKGSKPTK